MIAIFVYAILKVIKKDKILYPTLAYARRPAPPSENLMVTNAPVDFEHIAITENSDADSIH